MNTAYISRYRRARALLDLPHHVSLRELKCVDSAMDHKGDPKVNETLDLAIQYIQYETLSLDCPGTYMVCQHIAKTSRWRRVAIVCDTICICGG